MGRRKFRNYKHLLQVSHDGIWVDGSDFPASLGSYATIPKTNRGGSLRRKRYRYLDAVHMDIAFRDCVSACGYRCALILVDRATHYNWTFGLNTLFLSDIISALRLFRASAGRLARNFFIVIAIASYLVPRLASISLMPIQRSSPTLLNINLQMD